MRRARQPDRARRAVAKSPRRRWMVSAFCPLTGPWRQVVQAETASGALAKYCAEHDVNPAGCHVQPE
jgi:hypothetical protein